ncbi:MAG: hypothetical protein ACRYE8_04525 [Janthinobacterium lividum]
MNRNKFSDLCNNLENKLNMLKNLMNQFHVSKTHSNLAYAKISFNTILEGVLDPLILDYSSFAPSFLKVVLSFNGGINEILKSFKLDIMQGNSDACYTLAKVYEIGFFNQPKDEYNSMLLTLIGYKLGNRDCRKIIESEPKKYTILEYTANNFIENYLGKNLLICLDDAISSAHLTSLYNSAISDGYHNSYGNGDNFSSHDYIHSSDLSGN